MLEFLPAVGGRLVASTVRPHHAVLEALSSGLSACQQEPRELLLGTARQQLVSLTVQLGLCWQRRALRRAGPSALGRGLKGPQSCCSRPLGRGAEGP